MSSDVQNELPDWVPDEIHGVRPRVPPPSLELSPPAPGVTLPPKVECSHTRWPDGLIVMTLRVDGGAPEHYTVSDADLVQFLGTENKHDAYQAIVAKYAAAK